jgi:hypothetical protein
MGISHCHEETELTLSLKMTSTNSQENTLAGHTCNPSYSGGRDQEDHGLKPAWANNLRDSIWKIPNKKQC